VVEFVKKLQDEVDNYYSEHPVKNPNYEDIYHIARQIYDAETGEYDNPAIQPLIDKIRPDVEPLLTTMRLLELAKEACHYIHDVVWRMLKAPNNIAYLNFIKEALKDSDISNVDLFSLNQDLVLEEFLRQNNIEYTDGFDKPSTDDIRYWNPTLFEEQLHRLRLFKLHGSINWFPFRPGGWGSDRAGIPTIKDWINTHNHNLSYRPVILTGTYNKMLEYLTSTFIDLHYSFYRLLRETRYLIISGYSFGDRGINSRIINWSYTHPDNKIILIHANPEQLKNDARGSIKNKNWDHWIEKDKLRIIAKWIQKTSWDEIKEQLN